MRVYVFIIFFQISFHFYLIFIFKFLGIPQGRPGDFFFLLI